MLTKIQFNLYPQLCRMLFDRRGDDYGEKAVILVLVVLGGVVAFAAFGGRIVDLIGQATTGI
ncbi:hypothetical protein [Candidatus Villigracilis saccharophilus]|jgi:hypothetical protein|uniref:hypothetical protein n=1 Tax=Candidatus Villigracilis saccharophilus TaxID=3140684 RepID=UPI003135CBD6|nr:hypothetical protein [Anaerolineales bacterium]